MTVRVLAFARLRELFGFGERDLALPAAASIEDVWSALARSVPAAAALRPSIRFARNGALAEGSAALVEGDEIALLPPVGGG